MNKYIYVYTYIYIYNLYTIHVYNNNNTYMHACVCMLIGIISLRTLTAARKQLLRYPRVYRAASLP